MATAPVAYEDCSCKPGQTDFDAQVLRCLRALGSKNPEADARGARVYLSNAKAAGLPPGVAAGIAYATLHHGHALVGVAAETPASAPAAECPGVSSQDVVEAVQQTSRPSGLSFVPDVVRKLAGQGRSVEEARVALFEAAKQGSVELRPESGMGRLSPEDKRLVPVASYPGLGKVALSWVRATDRVAPAHEFNGLDPEPEREMLAAEDSAPRARARARTLRWHRQTEGYYAQGTLGRYEIHRRPPDRRHGVLPVVLLIPGHDPAKLQELNQFDTIDEAKDFAKAYDMVLPYAAPGRRDVSLSPEGHALVRGARIAEGCLPWVRVTKDPSRFDSCLEFARKKGAIDSGQKVYEFLGSYLQEQDQEVYLVVLLDVHAMVRGVAEVARGQRSRVMVDPSDILRVVNLVGASSFWCAHNHPSGKAEPSRSDRVLTKAIEKATKAYPGVEFRGHIVVGEDQWSDAMTGKIVRSQLSPRDQ